jgi:hypothetical protein
MFVTLVIIGAIMAHPREVIALAFGLAVTAAVVLFVAVVILFVILAVICRAHR